MEKQPAAFDHRSYQERQHCILILLWLVAYFSGFIPLSSENSLLVTEFGPLDITNADDIAAFQAEWGMTLEGDYLESLLLVDASQQALNTHALDRTMISFPEFINLVYHIQQAYLELNFATDFQFPRHYVFGSSAGLASVNCLTKTLSVAEPLPPNPVNLSMALKAQLFFLISHESAHLQVQYCEPDYEFDFTGRHFEETSAQLIALEGLAYLYYHASNDRARLLSQSAFLQGLILIFQHELYYRTLTEDNPSPVNQTTPTEGRATLDNANRLFGHYVYGASPGEVLRSSLVHPDLALSILQRLTSESGHDILRAEFNLRNTVKLLEELDLAVLLNPPAEAG